MRYCGVVFLISLLSTCAFGRESGLTGVSLPNPVPAISGPQLETTLVIDQVISEDTMGPIMTYMANAVANHSLPSDITLVINSPGGVVFTGFQFVALMNAAQQLGTKFHCIVPALAASMAFHIYTQCDTREALSGAHLLWHHARTLMGGGMFSQGVAVTSVAARTLALELEDIDFSILQSVQNAFGSDLSQEQIKFAFDNEIMHVASSLESQAPSFLKTSRVIPGLLEVMNNPKALRTARPGLLRVKIGSTTGVPVYILKDRLPELINQ